MSGGRSLIFSGLPQFGKTAPGIVRAVFAAGLLLVCAPMAVLAQNGPGLRPAIEPAQPANELEPPTDPYTEMEPAAVPPDPNRTAPNYARRRPLPDKRAGYKGRRKDLRRSLEPLEPYASAPRTIRNRPADAGPPPVQYAGPRQIPRKQKPKLEDNPYAPLGIDMGSVRVMPFVEFAGGYDTNSALSTAGQRGSSVMRIDAGFSAFSLWSRHEFRADVRGGWFQYFADPNANRPDGTARFTLRLDVSRDTRVDLELRGTLTTQRPGSPELNAAVVGRPAVASFGATAGVTRTFGRFDAGASVLVDRTNFEDALLTNGNSLRLSRDNYTAYGLRGRVGYEITPGIKPFAEVTVDTRKRDEPIDANGYARNSNGIAAKFGSTFEFSQLLRGELSAGYAQRKYQDARLPILAGGTIDASLVWTATPLTTVTFRAQTLLNETTVANAAGAISRRGSVEINHALMRNVNLGATAVWQNNKYQGISLSENILEGTLKAEYSLTRSVVVKGSFTHTRLKSSQTGADYTANIFLLGLRLQR